MFFVCSCGHEEYPGYEVTDTGLHYKFYKRSGDTSKPRYGDYLVVHLVKKIKDSVISSSLKASPKGFEYPLQKPKFAGSIEEGIRMMSKGDSASFIVSSDSIEKYFPAPDSSLRLPKGQMLTFDVKVLEIRDGKIVREERKKQIIEMYHKRKASEEDDIINYVFSNRIKEKPFPSGLYYIETQRGTGPSPKKNSKVAIIYSVKMIDGRVIEQGSDRDPFTFQLGDTVHKERKGLEEGLRMMKKGGKATLIIPSRLAFDSLGAQDPRTGYFKIPPFAPLVFDIELKDVK